MGGTTVTTKAERIGSVQLQQSSLGQPVGLGYGKCRMPSNLLWWGDFKSVAVTKTTKSGKGGVKQKDTTYEYTVAFQCALTDHLLLAIPKVWVGKLKFDGGTSLSGSSNATELQSVNADGIVKVQAYSRMTSVSSIHVCQSGSETADTLLTVTTHYTVAGGLITINVGSYPQYKGRVLRIVYAYSNTGLVSALTAAGFPFFANGSVGQAPYGYMSTNHPSEALGYSETSVLGASAYDLDDSASLPNHNFEVVGRLQYPNKDDCDPADVIADLLTNPTTGAQFPSERITGLTSYSAYCRANGLFISPAYTNAKEARLIIEELCDATNSATVWSEGFLKIIPYGDETVTGNGVTYTPNLTPLYDLDDDDFIAQSGVDPIQVQRVTSADAFNTLQVEMMNRAKDYNGELISVEDLEDIEVHGVRKADAIVWNMYADIDITKKAAWLYLQRKLNIRNQYTFSLGWKYALLEPMDIVTITDVGLGLSRKAVRIVEITEDFDGLLKVVAEDFLVGVASAATYSTQGSDGYIPDYGISSGNVAAPAIFEPPVDLTTNGLEVWTAVTGVNANWGGCTVWISYNGMTYAQLGRFFGGARYGSLTALVSASASAVASVQLAGLGGQMLSGTDAESANKATLCLVEDELVGHSVATLTGANAYNLTLKNRGFYKTTPASHASAQRFVRIDERIVKSGPIDYGLVGQDIKFKFTSFNIYGGAEQSLADVPEYSYTVRGNMLTIPPDDVTGQSYVLEGFGVRLNWTTVADKDLDSYEIRIGGANWAAATLLATVKGSSYLWAVQSAGSYTVRIRARDKSGVYSLNDAIITVVIATPNTVTPTATFADTDVVLKWGVVAGSFQIDRYEIRTGASWAAGTLVAIAYTTTFKEKASWMGDKTYWAAAIDVAGNVGTATSVTASVLAPASATPTAEVIDNNILLRWNDSKTTLPIVKYEIRKGATFGGATVVGVEANSRFSAFFEQVGGTFTYWVQATDSAGNVSVAASVAVLVNQPPDYILRLDFNSTLNGTLVNCFLQSGQLYAALNVSETFAQHFTNNAWATPQDQITAGKPLYFQPSVTSGSYEEVIDYGSILPATGIAATIGFTTDSGSVTITPTISVKTNIGDSWTDNVGQAQIVASNFRYVKVKYDFASTGGDDLIRVTNINVKLSSKIREDGGTGTAASGDAGGTTVTFNTAFIDVTAITVTPLATSAVIAVYDFTDVPNPTSFKVLLYNTSGTRVSGAFSWSAKGI